MASDEPSAELRGEMWNRVREWSDDEQGKARLADVLARLPEEPREAALERCFFVAIGGADLGGFVVPLAAITAVPETSWLIVLNSGWKGEDFQSAVAHEIAHVWLGHPGSDNFGPEAERHENEAAAQVREWGFTGIGSLPFGERP